jgi:hypothetical protein
MVFADKGIADRCCICAECGKPISAPADRTDFYGNRSYPTHFQCKHERDRLREIERMEEAEKVDSWDGWVYSDGHGHSEGYFDSVDEFDMWWIEEFGEDEPLPEFVRTSRAERIVPDGETIMERLLCEWFERGWDDMDESDLSGVAELKAAVEAFSNANEGVLAYYPNYKQAVRMRGGA